MWKQILFRVIGIAGFAGGLFAFYEYGAQLMPLFSQVLSGAYDFFKIFTVLSSFFFGALALTWVGIRCVALRTFSSTWVYYAALPITAWLQNLYDVGNIFSMDKILSLSIVYFCIYVLIVSITLFIRAQWYTPLSHEDMRHVGLEKPERSLIGELRWVLIFVVLVTLLILHPADIGTTLTMVVSPFVSVYNFVR